MDAKITKVRLGRMLSYDWLKIIGSATALIFVWVLIFTMTATRVRETQQFGIGNYSGNSSLSVEFSKDFSKAYKDGVFSYEVIETNTMDMTTAGENAYQLLEARTVTNELDLMFVSQQWDDGTKYKVEGKEDEIAYERTYLQSFVYGKQHSLHNLGEGGFFDKMEEYLNKYYIGGYENGSMDKEKVEADFRARIAKDKDKRYKKEPQIQKGIQGELERVEKYRNALVKFYEYQKQGYAAIVKTEYKNPETGEELIYNGGHYSINICTSQATAKMKTKLATIVGYPTTYLDEDGKEKPTISAENMNVCLFNSNGKEEAFRYEGLTYIVHLLDVMTAAETAN